MKKLNIILIIGLVFLFSFPAHSQKSLKGIAKIEVYDSEGNLLETGAGIVTGASNSEVFIATAFHVVDEGDNFLVTFYSRQWEQFKARVHPKFNPDLDYAVLIASVPNNKLKMHDFRQPYYASLKPGSKVVSVGHPSGEEWVYNTQNVINNPKMSTFEVGFSNIGIAPGYSGGALISNKKEQLIGLIVNVETQNTIAVRMDQVIRDLNSWGIPYDNILPYKPPRRASFYVFSILTAGAGAGAFYLNNQVDQKYETYSSKLDRNDPAYGDISREDYFDKILQERQYTYYALGATAFSGILAIILSKRKYKQVDDRFGFHVNPYDPYIAGAKVGFNYKF